MADPEVVAALGVYFDAETLRKLDVESEASDEDNETSVVEEQVVECEAAVVHHEPGPYSEDISDDDFSSVPRSALILSFRDEQCEEVSLSLFLFCISVVFCFCCSMS
jgi:hypothetical protein